MKSCVNCFPGGKTKAVTFSYDDGVTQDKRLIEIFNKHDLKATFNLNFDLLGLPGQLERDNRVINHTKNNPRDIKYIYEGHEVAAHTLTHPNLTLVNDDETVIRQVERDRINLSELVGYEVKGMAYPGGGVNCNERIADLIRNNTPIEYARTTATTGDFEPYENLYQYKGTVYHHAEWGKLFEMAQVFLKLNAETPKIFYIWGHSYEFDIYPERWELFDEFCGMIGNKEDIFYGTNLEVLCCMEMQN